MSWLSDFLKPKKESISTYTSPQWNEQYNALKGLTFENLSPKYTTMANQMWQDELMPNVREAYETKRNPYGGSFADTPEFANLSKESRNLSTTAMSQAAKDYMNIQQMLTGMVGQPTTMYQGATNPLAGLVTGVGTLAGNLFSDYMGNQALTSTLKDLGYGNTAKEQKPSAYEDYYNQNKDSGGFGEYADLASNLLPLALALL